MAVAPLFALPISRQITIRLPWAEITHSLIRPTREGVSTYTSKGAYFLLTWQQFFRWMSLLEKNFLGIVGNAT